MVHHAASHYNLLESCDQDFFVSETLIEELESLHALLLEDKNQVKTQEEKSKEELISLTDSMVEFSQKCTKSRAEILYNDGILHLFLGYKDYKNDTVWMYAYFLRKSTTLVFLPCSSDPEREVLKAASKIIYYLQGIWDSFEVNVTVVQIQWKQVSTSGCNSGFIVFKEFLVQALEIKKPRENEFEKGGLLISDKQLRRGKRSTGAKMDLNELHRETNGTDKINVAETAIYS